MSSVTAAVLGLQELFAKQMGSFQARLDQAPGDLPVLRADFLDFQKSVWAAIETLQNSAAEMEERVDELEAHTRRNLLLMHGVQEREGEDLVAIVCRVYIERLGLAVTPADIDECYRLGKTNRTGKRPILVRFVRNSTRARVWGAKRRLKDSGITASEFLSANRRNIYLEARKAFGDPQCWTRAGAIFVLLEGGIVRVTSCAQLQGLAEAATKGDTPASEEPVELGKKERTPRSCVANWARRTK